MYEKSKWDEIDNNESGYRLYVNKDTSRKFLKVVHNFIENIPDGKTLLVSIKYKELDEVNDVQ